MKEIFDYTNYRQYLKDWYDEEKSNVRGFSYRWIAQQVGFKSPGQFTKILKGQIHISLQLAERFADFMKLKQKERDYFFTLILFERAKSHQQKNKYWKKITSFKGVRVKSLESDQYELFDKWYYIAIREVFAYYKFNGDYRDLGHQLDPAISADESQRAIELLLRLNLLRKTSEGSFERDVSGFSTNYKESNSLAINNFLLSTIELGKRAMDHFQKPDRTLSWATLSVSKTKYKELEEEVRKCQLKLLEIAQKESNPDTVYQFNFQMFPLTKFKKNSDEE